MIREIQVKKLFGIYDYSISFVQNPSVDIITGPNGYGKTTLLLIINNIFNGKLWYFHFLVFDTIIIKLSEQTVCIRKQYIQTESLDDSNHSDRIDDETHQETITLSDNHGNLIESIVIDEEIIQKLIYSCKRRNFRESENLTDAEIIERYSVEDDNYISQLTKNLSLALQEYRTKFLPAQRVYNYLSNDSRFNRWGFDTYVYEIDHVNDEIASLYRTTQNSFASTSQRIDATFISRLITREEHYSKDTLNEKLNLLKQRIDYFKSLNLFNNMELLDNSWDDDDLYGELKNVLSQYVDDMNAKMDCFEELYKKIALYKRVLEHKILSEKNIDFSENGLSVINSKGHILSDLHKLSSGEQNLLILYYNLIFKSNSKTILLIDEPENSLHVAWQCTMLDDYIEMAKTTGCQIIFSTHSPTFIDGRWDLTTDLYMQHLEAAL